MSNWLITGGAGFIGGNFVNRLAIATQDPIFVIDSLSYAGNLQCIDPLIRSGRIQFFHASICDEAAVNGALEKSQANRLIHFAAESHVDRSIVNAKPFIEANILGTYTLLEGIRKYWKGKTDSLFIHVSTDEVFGDLEPDDPPFEETTAYAPSSPYSASKAASDHLVRAWHRTYGLPVVITNCSNNFGPWQFPEKLIPLVICNAMVNKPLPIYGTGSQIRDWLHVDDHCDAIMAAAASGRIGETYLIGGNNELRNIDVVRTICHGVDHYLGRPQGTSERLIAYVKDRAGHDVRYAINASKIRTQLGWEPKVRWEESIAALVAWYAENATWRDSIVSGVYRSFYARNYG